jgi:hypothetical protein
MERAISFIPKLSIAVLEATLEGAIQGAVKALGPKTLDLMIDKNFYIIDAIFYATRHQPTYPPELSREQVARLEMIRATMSKTVLPLLGMVKFVASKFPPEAVEAKVTPDWLLRRGDQRFPELSERVRAKGERGRWWLEKQAEELRAYATGRAYWSEEERKLVIVNPKKA